MKAIVYIIIVAVLLAISFYITAGLVWLVCWAFNLAWSWKISLGVWAVLCLISSVVKSTGGSK